MSRAYTICQALAEETLLRHTAIAMDKILKPTPQVEALLQAARDNKQDELAERFHQWAKAEGWNVEPLPYGTEFDDERTEYAWRAVKALCL